MCEDGSCNNSVAAGDVVRSPNEEDGWEGVQG